MCDPLKGTCGGAALPISDRSVAKTKGWIGRREMRHAARAHT